MDWTIGIIGGTGLEDPHIMQRMPSLRASLRAFAVCCCPAVLAKELGIPYASMAVVTDFDCWRDTAEGVSISLVDEMMRKNAHLMQIFL
ncbi:hypothetical protein GPALN_005719 [Globodera pallida]|nr:hypothetical protein GPALN_005719 [Globodera pallida]